MVEVVAGPGQMLHPQRPKKAEGARCEAFLSPRPPDETGSDACNRDGLPGCKSMFVILAKIDKSSSSQDSRRDEEKAGDVRSM